RNRTLCSGFGDSTGSFERHRNRERTAYWTERLGFDHIKEILQDVNIVTKLNERFQTARGTYKEAWGQALETKSLKAMYEVETVK
ncbi:hypothetical protein ACUOBA_40285, partial [Escherichia coli]